MGLQQSRHGVIVRLSQQNLRPGLATRTHKGAQAPTYLQLALFLCPLYRVMVAVRGRPSGLPAPFVVGSPTCAQSPPSFWREMQVAPITKELHPCNTSVLRPQPAHALTEKWPFRPSNQIPAWPPASSGTATTPPRLAAWKGVQYECAEIPQ